MLSSTYADLNDYRRAAIDALERLGHQVGRMEIFGARPLEPTAACLQEIDECDLFVGIYAHRYGFVPNGSAESIVEQEFQRAAVRLKPAFCFIVADDYGWPSDLIEPEPGAAKLRAFKNLLRTRLVVETFGEPADLALKVATGVARFLTSHHHLISVPPRDSEEVTKRNELIRFLEARKDAVLAALEISAAKDRFLILHTRNVEAIQNGDLLLSHLLTADIRRSLGQELGRDYTTGDRLLGDRLRAPLPLPTYPSLGSPQEEVRGTNLDSAGLQSESWRDLLLSRWADTMVRRFENALSKAQMVRAAEERGVQSVKWNGADQVFCPHCQGYVPARKSTEEVLTCSKCLTKIRLVLDLTPEEYKGHVLVRGVCTKCGLTSPYIKHFQKTCNP